MVTFTGQIRRWREDTPGGLAVVDIPADLVTDLGGRRQTRVTGTLNNIPFTGSTMLVAGGGLCVGVSKAALKAASAAVANTQPSVHHSSSRFLAARMSAQAPSASVTTSSAYPPNRQPPSTRSPTATLLTPSPSDSTSPANS